MGRSGVSENLEAHLIRTSKEESERVLAKDNPGDWISPDLAERAVRDALSLGYIVEAIREIEPMEDGYHPFLKQGFEEFRSRVNTIIKKGGGG